MAPSEHEDDGNETERKAQVMTDQQHQQPPGGQEHQPQRCIKNRTIQESEAYIMEEVDFLPH